MRFYLFKNKWGRCIGLSLAALLLVQCFPVPSRAEVSPEEDKDIVESLDPEEEETLPEQTEETEETEETEQTEPTEKETLPEQTEAEEDMVLGEDISDDYEDGTYVQEDHDGPFFPDYTLEEYGSVMYASGTILDNGCSVVCMASLATYMTGHQYYPDELAGYFGAQCDNNVQRLEYMSDQLELPYYKAENYTYVLDALRDGKVVIQLMNSKSLFTNSQHFILIKGYNENGLLDVYDPSEKNRDGWYLRDKFAYGFTEDELCWGYDGAWIYDPDQMPDDPYIYEPPVREYVEPRYGSFTMTEEETNLLARLVWVESRGESAQGQQAIAEVVLNRFTSGLYGKSLTAMINDEDAFVKRKLLKSAKPGQAQYEAIDRALYGPYVLPKEVMFYGRVRTTNNVWGTIGGHIFCYPNDYVMDKSDYR